MPLGGRFRLVDIPISNCINSGIEKIYLLTQFNSVSLHEHIQSAFRFDDFSKSFVRIMPAQQTPDSDAWYTGTADAVRKVKPYIDDVNPDLVIILSGDQLYRMDFQDVVDEHIANKAAVTIATKPVSRREAGALGIMQIDDKKEIVNFFEKPGDTPKLDELASPQDPDLGITDNTPYLASMGIYVFNADVLYNLLLGNKDLNDFGKNIIPLAIEGHPVYSYVFDGYWKDIGTIGMFHEENLSLTDPVPAFDFYDPEGPIYTRRRTLPPSKIQRCDVDRCLFSEGCIMSGTRLVRTILGVRAIVGEGTQVFNSVLMGADFYDWQDPMPGALPIGIGRNCKIDNAIIDKNCRIGDHVTISPEGKSDGEQTDKYWMRDGIIVIPKGTEIPSGSMV